MSKLRQRQKERKRLGLPEIRIIHTPDGITLEQYETEPGREGQEHPYIVKRKDGVHTGMIMPHSYGSKDPKATGYWAQLGFAGPFGGVHVPWNRNFQTETLLEMIDRINEFLYPKESNEK